MTATTTETDKRRGRIRIETGARRVRVYLGGDVTSEHPHAAVAGYLGVCGDARRPHVFA